MATETVGERLKRLRKERGLTREYVAKAIGSSNPNLYKYESGFITNIPIEKIEQLAALYQVSPSYILTWDDDSDNEAATDKKGTASPATADFEQLIQNRFITYKGTVYTLNDDDIQKLQMALDLALFDAGKRTKKE